MRDTTRLRDANFCCVLSMREEERPEKGRLVDASITKNHAHEAISVLLELMAVDGTTYDRCGPCAAANGRNLLEQARDHASRARASCKASTARNERRRPQLRHRALDESGDAVNHIELRSR